MSTTTAQEKTTELQKLRSLQKTDQTESVVSVDQQYLTFLLKNEVYGVEILAVKEIIAYGSLTDIPLVHPAIEGVINLRGNVVPVINLHVRFDRPSTEVTKLTSVIVVEIGEGDDKQEMGIVVDGVDEVLNIREQDIDPVPAFGVSIPQDYIIGMGKVDGNFIMLLDIHRILDVNELANLKRNLNGRKKRGTKAKMLSQGTASAPTSMTTSDGIFLDPAPQMAGSEGES